MMLLASVGGNRIPVIAQLVQADEDTVREVLHRFNDIGLACLDPGGTGGRPRLLSDDDEDFVIHTATTRPAKLGEPFTRWSTRRLAAYLRRMHGRVIGSGREPLRCLLLLLRRGTFQPHHRTGKQAPDLARDTKLDRIEQALDRFPDRVLAFDEFGPLGIRPTAGSCRAKQGNPNCLPATYRRTHGVPTSTAATPSVTTGCGASTAARKGAINSGRAEAGPRRPTRRRADLHHPGQLLRPHRHGHPSLAKKNNVELGFTRPTPPGRCGRRPRAGGRGHTHRSQDHTNPDPYSATNGAYPTGTSVT